ncbi:uncharacterized protein PAC_13498 [Phialocephala subalpina]|uniref:Zn(2)-C6 fungal-type domain-containing protein n=1 Tax=Phialocephala subalpina TaxID=576137 RepID=A0A1L7XEZ9_9HELO|nr:uncharacterized protein PAC_13498 [Phialocephala subalpina]
MESKTDLQQKQRRKAPKSRTGCPTCKIRRLKCDETRPHCQRCIKFGVECDGYPPVLKRKSPRKREAPPHPAQQAQQATKVPSLGPTSLEKSPFANAEEHRYFDLFCARTGYEIFPAFDSGSTRLRLLEFCGFNPAIRHATVALGALDKTSELVQDFEKLSLTSAEREAAANEHHQNALQQYAKAVKYMTADAAEKHPDMRTMLLTCLLTLAFESWTGNLDLAVKQVHAGIRLIQEWKAKYKGQEEKKPPRLSPAPDLVEDDLIQIFCRLAVQNAFFADEHSPELHSILGMEGSRYCRTMPDEFSSIYEASNYYNGLIRRGVYFLTAHPGDLLKDPEICRWAIKEQEEIQADVWRFNKAFESVAKKIDCIWQRHYALFIQLSLSIGYIAVSTRLSTDEMIHDDYNPVYKRVVFLAESVLKEMPSRNKKRPTNFCFDTRVIVPLWMAGLKCRERSIRRAAINLLLSWPRREGIWDSVFAGRVLQWVMKVEEEFLEKGEEVVPGWARVPGVRWSGVLGERRAELVTVQRVSKEGEERVRRSKTITW